MVNPRKKESVDSEIVGGRVSKFYWWVAIRSRVWGLVGFKFTLKIVRLNPPQVFTGLVSWVIMFCVFYFSATLHDIIV